MFHEIEVNTEKIQFKFLFRSDRISSSSESQGIWFQCDIL